VQTSIFTPMYAIKKHSFAESFIYNFKFNKGKASDYKNNKYSEKKQDSEFRPANPCGGASLKTNSQLKTVN